MASFFEDLWGSIFIPGPTPTLLVATNAAFAALQALLLGLLFATYSVHFVILSFLCAGLWWSINWFSKEVRAFQASEEEKKRAVGNGSDESKSQSKIPVETDSEDEAISADVSSLGASGVDGQPGSSSALAASADASNAGRSNSDNVRRSNRAAATLAPSPADDALRQRRSLAESTGDLSTDSDWEKVEDE